MAAVASGYIRYSKLKSWYHRHVVGIALVHADMVWKVVTRDDDPASAAIMALDNRGLVQ
jgi:hypothetical protein